MNKKMIAVILTIITGFGLTQVSIANSASSDPLLVYKISQLQTQTASLQKQITALKATMAKESSYSSAVASMVAEHDTLLAGMEKKFMYYYVVASSNHQGTDCVDGFDLQNAYVQLPDGHTLVECGVFTLTTHQP